MSMAYVVCAKWRAKEGKADRLLEVIEEMTPPSRAEPGNRFYQAQRSAEDPQLFFLYEQYADEAGYEAHMASEHFTRLVKEEAIPDLLEDRAREFYETIGDEAGGLGGS
jgi:quinol monooxygenase YgiN